MEYSVAVEAIVSKIYYIRGERVLLDRDLAVLYGVKTEALKTGRQKERQVPTLCLHRAGCGHAVLRSQQRKRH
jgi:hypothetical protein